MKKLSILILSGAFLVFGCKDKAEKKEEKQEPKMEKQAMKAEEKNQEWKYLFKGENLDHWKAYNSDSISDQWQVQDSAIVFTPAKGKREGTENLISKEEFSSFELSLEWKISEGGNSGIMWAVQEDKKYDEPYLTGPEIQVLDNKKHPDAKNGPIRQAGALYDMVAPEQDVTKPAGEWNKEVLKIDYEANKGTVTLNGTKLIEFPLHGEEWEKMVANSKFKDWEAFGKFRKGHIALQDHGDKVWYRNIKIRELN